MMPDPRAPISRDNVINSQWMRRTTETQQRGGQQGSPDRGVSVDNLPDEYHQSQDPFLNRLTRIVDAQDGSPIKKNEAERMMAAAHLSARTGFDVDYTYRHLREVAEWAEKNKRVGVTTRTHLAESWQRGQAQMESALLANQAASQQIMGKPYKHLMEEARKISQSAPAMRERDEIGLAAQFLGAAAEQMPRSGRALGRGALAAAAVGGGALLMKTGLGAPAGAALMATALPAGGKAMKAASIHSLAQGYAGSTFMEIDAYQTPDGEKIDPMIAAVSSKAVGLVVGAAETFALSRIPGVRESGQAIKNIAARAAGDAVTTSLMSGVLPQTIARSVGRWGGSIGIGVANEVFQETMQILGVELSKGIDERVNQNPWERMIWDDHIDQDGNRVPGLRDRYNQVIRQSAMSYTTMGLPGTVVGGIGAGRSTAKAHRANNAKSQYEATMNAARESQEANLRQDFTRISSNELSERIRVASEEFQKTPSKEKGIQLARVIREESRRPESRENLNLPDPTEGPKNSIMSRERSIQVDNELTTRYQSASIWNKLNVNVNVPQEHRSAFVALVDMAARSNDMDIDTYVEQVFQDDVARMGDLGENRGQTIWDGAKALMVLGENSDISTLFHEFGHVILPTLSQDHMQAVESWWQSNNITNLKDKHESFARALEYYLYEGRTADNELHGVFSRIKEWMQEVYRTFRMEWEFTPEIRQVFDQIFIDDVQPGQDTATAVAAESAPTHFSESREVAYESLYDRLADAGIHENQEHILKRLEYIENAPALEQLLEQVEQPVNDQASAKFAQYYERGEFGLIDPAEAMVQINREQITTQGFNLSQSLIPDEELYQGPTTEYADYAWQMKVNSERAAAILETTEYIPDSLLQKFSDDPMIQEEMSRRNRLRQEAMTFMRKTREYGGDVEGRDGFIAMASMDHADTFSEDYLAHIWESAIAMSPENIRNPQLMDQAFVENMTPDKLEAFFQAAASAFRQPDIDSGVLSEIFRDEFFSNTMKSKTVASQGLTDAQVKNFLGKIKANPRHYRRAFAELSAVTGQEMKTDETGGFTTTINEAAIELDRIMAEEQFTETRAEASAMSEQVFELRKELRDKTASFNSVQQELMDERSRWAQSNHRRRQLQGELETLMIEQRQAEKMTAQEKQQLQRDIDRLSQEDPMVPSRIKRLNTSDRVKQRLLSLYEQDKQHKETQALIGRIENAEQPLTPGQIQKLKASDTMKQRLGEIYELHRGFQQNKNLLNRLTKTYKPLTPAQIDKLSTTPEMKQRLHDIYNQYKSDMETRAEFRRGVYAKIKLKNAIDKKIKDIMRDPSSNTTNFEQAQQIRELQARFSMRNTDSLRRAQEVARETLANSADEETRAAAQFILDMKPITELSLDELTDIADKIEQIRKEGRQALQEKKNLERFQLEAFKEAIIDELGHPEKVRGVGSIEADKEIRSNPKRVVQFATFRPWGVAEILSGNRKGTAWSLLWDQTNEAVNKQLVEAGRRTEAGQARMKALGITETQLRKKVEVDGLTYSRDQVIGMYLLAQNDKQFAALVHGNGVSIDGVEAAIKGLTDAEKKWGDFIHDDFQDNYPRLRESYIEYSNKDLGYVENYFPLIRKWFGGKNQDMLIQELMQRSGKKFYAEHNWRHERQEMSNEHQMAVRLDATSIWEEMVGRQEKFISHGKHIRNLHRVFSDGDVQQAIASEFGHGGNQWIRKYINDITNSNFFRTYDTASQMSRMLRSNLAISVLAGNPITMLRQTASLAYGMHHANPANMIGAANQLITNRKETIDFIEANSPQVKYRSTYRVFEDFQALENLSLANKKIAKFGMAGIQAFDKVAVYTLWKATYDHQTNTGMDHNTAVKAADQAILETQPAARAKDLSEIQRGPEGMQWFMMFSNQLNQIWTNLGYRTFHTESVEQLGWMLGGMALGAVMIGSINRKRLPRDAREVGEDLIDQLLSSVPIAGDSLSSQFTGSYSTGTDPLPVVGQVLRTSRTIADGEADTERRLKAVTRLLFELGKTTGVPTVQPERMLRALREEDPWQLIGGPPSE